MSVKLSGLTNKSKSLMFGILTVIIALEIAVRIFGHIYNWEHETGVFGKKNKKSNEYRIMAVGNSYTLGAGAPKGEGYPGHLQRYLDENISNIKFNVFNEGIGSANSAVILREFKKDVIEINPHLIILRAGEQNSSRRDYITDYLTREKIKTSTFLKITYFLHDLLDYSRFYRLSFNFYKIIIDKYRVKPKDYDHQWNEQLTQINKKVNHFFKNNNYNISKNEADTFLKWLKNEQSENMHAYTYYWIGQLYVFHYKNFKSAFDSYVAGIKRDPGFSRNPNYSALHRLKEISSDDIKNKINQFIIEWSKKYPNDKPYLIYDNNICFKWARSDIEEMLKIAKKRKIPVIMHSYPLGAEKNLFRIGFNILLKTIAKENNIPFVDLENILKEKYNTYNPTFRS